MQKLKQSLRAIGLIITILCTLFILELGYIFSFYSAVPHKSDCIVVFGASVGPGGTPSRALRDRVIKAAELYHDAYATCVILSGAPSVYGIHEVDVMNTLIRKAGVPDSVIRKDYHGYSTLQTILNLPADKVYLFVSNDFHLARIAWTAKMLGKSGFVVPSRYTYGRPHDEWWRIGREAVGIVYYTAVLIQMPGGGWRFIHSVLP